MSLQDITIAITSFLRPGMLQDCLNALQRYLPECPVIVCDDSDTLPTKLVAHARWITMPFDSGISAKRNAISQETKTKYILLYCDDFKMDPEARSGVLKLLDVLENNPEIDLAAGHVNNQCYEGFLTLKPGEYIKETRLVVTGKQSFYPVELTVNYFLAKTSVLQEVPWDERMKIGGEHGQFFMDMKLAGKKVVWVPGVNVEEYRPDASKQDKRYAHYRSRAWELGHQIFLKKYGVLVHYGFDAPIKNPRVLVAVVACNGHRGRVEEQRRTWLPKLAPWDYKVFYGRGEGCLEKDEIRLDCRDDYEGLPEKVKGIVAYALEHGYDYLFKVDSDTLVIPDRLKKIAFVHYDYIGRRNARIEGHYVSGGPGMFLSRRAMEILNAAPLTDDTADDRWIGDTLRTQNIFVTHMPNFILYPFYDESKHSTFVTACNVLPSLVYERRAPASLTTGVGEMSQAFVKQGRLPTLKELQS